MDLTTDVAIVGGGPAGLVLGLLLARAGVDVVVLEKHADFLRDFRGDTVHPSTLDLLDELGLADGFLRLPHRKVEHVSIAFGDTTYPLADFTRLPGRHRYIAMVPQWDLLDFLADEATRRPSFRLLRSTEVVDVVRADGAVRGVRALSPAGPVEVAALLTVAADGRNSVVTERVGLPRRTFGVPMDVLWFRLSRRPDDPVGVQFHAGAARFLAAIDRGSYWQVGYQVRKGGYDDLVAAGLPAFRTAVAELAPQLADRVDEITSWDEIKVLTVRLERLRRWYAPGMLAIGDAAHAMSPVFGVGINLAVQDAVAAARLLVQPLRARTLSTADLARVQRRRWPPTALIQFAQRIAHRAFLQRVLASDRPPTAPAPLTVLRRVPPLQGVTARIVGHGLRREQPPRGW